MSESLSSVEAPAAIGRLKSESDELVSNVSTVKCRNSLLAEEFECEIGAVM